MYLLHFPEGDKKLAEGLMKDPKEKAEQEMHFHHCDVEKEEILPLI